MNTTTYVLLQELSPSSAAVLALDEGKRLHSIDLTAAKAQELAKGVGYAQWAPSQDILVAQSEGKCLLWLDVGMTESIHLQDCQGQLVGLVEAQVSMCTSCVVAFVCGSGWGKVPSARGVCS